MDEFRAGPVGALIGVRPEEIALRLGQVLRQLRAAIAVEIGKRRRHRRNWNSHLYGGGYQFAPRSLEPLQPGHELRIQQQTGQAGLTFEGAHDVIEEARANDATALPDARHLAQVNVPLPLVRPGADEAHALRIRANLGCIQGIVYGLNQFLLSSGIGYRRGRLDEATSDDALVLHAGDHARVQRGGDGWNRHRQVEGHLGRPLASTFLSGLIENHVDQRLAALRLDGTLDL